MTVRMTDPEFDEILKTYAWHDRAWIGGKTAAERAKGKRETKELYAKFIPASMTEREFFVSYFSTLLDVFQKRVRELKEKNACERIRAKMEKHTIVPTSRFTDYRVEGKGVHIVATCYNTGIHYHKVRVIVIGDEKSSSFYVVDEHKDDPWNGNFYKSIEAALLDLEKKYPDLPMFIDAIILTDVLKFRDEKFCCNTSRTQ